jgi:hypothetical protein
MNSPSPDDARESVSTAQRPPPRSPPLPDPSTAIVSAFLPSSLHEHLLQKHGPETVALFSDLTDLGCKPHWLMEGLPLLGKSGLQLILNFLQLKHQDPVGESGAE